MTKPPTAPNPQHTPEIRNHKTLECGRLAAAVLRELAPGVAPTPSHSWTPTPEFATLSRSARARYIPESRKQDLLRHGVSETAALQGAISQLLESGEAREDIGVDSSSVEYRTWPHTPSHLFIPESAYIITVGTYNRVRLFNTSAKLDYLNGTVFNEAERFGWRLEAWAFMANHYHLIAHAPQDAKSLSRLMRAINSRTAIWLNRIDGVSGRKVWYQYRDTCITNRESYMARLRYVHENPAHHGVVPTANQYRWCSMGWFEQNANAGYYNAVMSFGTERLSIDDDF